jgi:hypothetical protein
MQIEHINNLQEIQKLVKIMIRKQESGQLSHHNNIPCSSILKEVFNYILY